MDSSPSSSHHQHHQQHPQQQHHSHQTPAPSSTAGPQIRSRITVVCAECKRLKLKCDRRTPCGSCVKRDTVSRCIYSPAAAEKVDLHSLNNRLIAVESTIALLSSCPLPSSSSFPNSTSTSSLTTSSSLFGNRGAEHSGNTSALHLSIDELAHTWMDDAARNLLFPSPSFSATSSTPQIKPDPDHPPVPAPSSSSHPPLFLPPSSAPSLACLPSSSDRKRLYEAAARAMRLYPGFSVFGGGRLAAACEDAIRWAERYMSSTLPTKENDWSSREKAKDKDKTKERETARAIFFGRPSDPLLSMDSDNNDPNDPDNEDRMGCCPARFAHAAAVLALGALVLSVEGPLRVRGGGDDGDEPEACVLVDGGALPPRRRSEGRARASTTLSSSVSKPRHPVGKEKEKQKRDKDKDKDKDKEGFLGSEVDAQALLALAHAALAGVEGGEGVYDVEWVRAVGTLVLCGVYEGHTVGRGLEAVFVLLGKLVNGARLAGLSRDHPGGREQRRVWWAVVWWDVFISDALGHTPLISPGSFNTRLPSASSLSTKDEDNEEVDAAEERDAEYFVLQCRLAQLLRTVKKHTDDTSGYCGSLEQATALENEVTQWLADLPPRFRLDDGSPGSEPFIAAQRSALALTAHRLVLKLYAPFIPRPAAAPTASAHQAAAATVNAAHGIVRALPRVLRSHAALLSGWSAPARDAAIVCAHAVIRAPDAVWTVAAMDDAWTALGVLKEATGVGEKVVSAVEGMIRAAEAARGAGAGGSVGTKRKRDEGVEGEAYPVIADAKQDVASSPAKPPSALPKEKEKHGSKKMPYPPVGIRVRPGKEGPPAVRQRVESGSPTSRVPAPPFPSSRAPAVPPSRAPSVMSGGFQRRNSSVATASSATQEGVYHQPLQDERMHRPQSQSLDGRMQQQPPMQQMQPDVMSTPTPTSSTNVAFTLPFGNGDDSQRMDMGAIGSARRYSAHDIRQPGQIQCTPGPYDAYSAAPSPAFVSSGQHSSAGSPYTGTGSGSVPGSATSPFTNMPLAPHRSTPPNTYGAPHQQPPPVPNGHSSQGYFIPSTYDGNYESGSSMNAPLVGLGMGLGQGSMDTGVMAPPPSVPGTPRDMLYGLPPDNKGTYDMKPPDALQPPFGHGEQQQGWPQDGSGTAGSEYWNNGAYNYT